LLEHVPPPGSAAADALHIAIAITNGMDDLLTWNCTHITNAALRSRIAAVCQSRSFEILIICTPGALLEE
jgi:hypothetical protein